MYSFKRFEEILSLHCSPTLLGIKPSNLISCYKNKYSNIPYLIETYNSILNNKNISIEILCEYKSYYLVLVYNRYLLGNILTNPHNKKFLNLSGYKHFSISDSINTLKHRVVDINRFPHEIGVFLGYPLDDIIAFIENKGEDYKFYGYWKVYFNEDYARSIFSKYDRCREFFIHSLSSGKSLEDILGI